MITFEQNLLLQDQVKQDKIIFTDNHYIIYRVTSNINHTRWFIAITEIKNGNPIERKDLSVLVQSYSMVISYIATLPNVILELESSIPFTDELRNDLNKLEVKLHNVLAFISIIKDKYCGKKKDSITDKQINEGISSIE